MGIYRGPGVITKDLVFGYDSGYGVADNDTATRFYSGEPITNYLSSGVSNLNVVQRSDWYGATPTFTLGTSEFGTPIGTYTVGSTSYMYSRDEVLDDDLSTLSGQAVTFSIYLKRSGGSNIGTVGIRVYDNVSGYTTVYAAATSEFQRFTLTKTLGANPTRIFVMIDNTNGGVIDFHSPQLEIGSTASPFVDGTRSDTTSLIDLKRTNSIDVSDMSFDSTGQPEFDGTDDIIGTGISTAFTDFSCVVVFKQSVNTAWARLVDKYYVNGFFMSSYFLSGGSGYVGAGIIEPSNPHGQSLQYDNTKYNYFVVTRSGTTHTIYLNGSSNYASKTGSGAALNSAEIHVGAWYNNSSSQRFTGSIPVVKIYDRALTAEEVQQDFGSYKNRFNI
jgi:hypothetical protein